MDELIADVPRIRGRSTLPKIRNIKVPLSEDEMLFDEYTIALDTAMGYGCDIAQVKKWFYGAECHGMDKLLGTEYSYEDARAVVKKALGEDILPECVVRTGDALTLEGYEPDYFNRVLSIGLIHHLARDERNVSFEKAYEVLRKDGIFVCSSSSGIGLEPFAGLKGKYDWDKVRKNLSDGSPNLNLDRHEREMFLQDVQKICAKYGIQPKTQKDWNKIEQVAGMKDQFKIMELRPDIIGQDLGKIGYRKVNVQTIDRPEYTFVKGLNVYALK